MPTEALLIKAPWLYEYIPQRMWLGETLPLCVNEKEELLASDAVTPPQTPPAKTPRSYG